MSRTALIHTTPVAVSSRLRELGVSEALLHQSVESGMQHAFGVTLHDPLSAEGSMMFFKTVRGLRDGLVPLGWKPDRAKNYETTVHPSGSHAIAVAAGDENTGMADHRPTTKRHRGPATRAAVEVNYQLDLFELPPVTTDALHTWLLLHRIDKDKNEVRCELSLPLEMTSDGYVSSWQERVILGPIPFDRDPVFLDDSDDSTYEVGIERKSI